MGFWERQVSLKNKILRGEEEAAAARDVPRAVPVRDWFLWQEQQGREAEAARLERDRVATEAHEARKRRDMEAGFQAQALWAEQRGILRARVVELQQALAGAEQRTANGEIDDAIRAAGEAEVFRVRLAQAESAFASHCQRSPL